jgi:hypothetical protein
MRQSSLVAAAVVALASVAGAQPSASEPAPPRGVGASYLDHAIVAVRPVDKDLVELLIEDRGRAKAPVPIAVIRVGNDTTRCEVPLAVFLSGTRVTRFRVPARPAIVRVVLDPAHEYPDADRRNDVWVAGKR